MTQHYPEIRDQAIYSSQRVDNSAVDKPAFPANSGISHSNVYLTPCCHIRLLFGFGIFFSLHFGLSTLLGHYASAFVVASLDYAHRLAYWQNNEGTEFERSYLALEVFFGRCPNLLLSPLRAVSGSSGIPSPLVVESAGLFARTFFALRRALHR